MITHLPCGHRVECEKCAQLDSRRRRRNGCPICAKPVKKSTISLAGEHNPHEEQKLTINDAVESHINGSVEATGLISSLPSPARQIIIREMVGIQKGF
jgi:NAD-dependent SIR2 family protein deacetylase